MPAISYRNTDFTIPGWVPFTDKERRGIAYETNTHFVHLYGKELGLYVISVGLTVTESKSGTLDDWVRNAFGATDVQQMTHEPGHTTEGVWRPGLYYDDEMLQGLGATQSELRLAEQSLLLLIQRLDELLLFVEPDTQTLGTFSHKARELLILACTEVESSWKGYLRRAGVQEPPNGFSTNQYVRLKHPLYLDEFEVSLPRYAAVPRLRPFHNWSAASPTKSLDWYDAYNLAKHDRSRNFSSATVLNCIKATAANVVLFAVRFGPVRLFHGAGTLSALFNHLFSIELTTPDFRSFYAPLISLPPNQRTNRICFGSREMIQPWIVDPFRI